MYFWLFTEKLKFITAVYVNTAIQSNILLAPSQFNGFTSLLWYKDEGLILNNTQLFKMYTINSLEVKYQHPAFNGFFHAFYKNDAGVGVMQFVKISDDMLTFTSQIGNSLV